MFGDFYPVIGIRVESAFKAFYPKDPPHPVVPPVDWDARPRAWLMYLKHLKDTDETAYQALIAKLDAGELADVKWAASAQRTGDHDQADETERVVFSDTEEELQWQDPKAFFRSWAHSSAKDHRAKIREQRTEIEARKKGVLISVDRQFLA
ncbi:hypothetical protein COL26b_013410 [Colletotrichum chrysophilum]|uniref:uncharacterized protein n=1 Tax=Colletotrichum chrysophilum TaxID=1836956 RepID=UPI0023012EB6|nr:uncharacterized protein COL26b_013410 [Colletotrichum chrysophilum]KAJ0362290.1 hypothetical protein COL26b_013410 [Colletotrichum chrysophilum]